MGKTRIYCIAQGCRNNERNSDCRFFSLPTRKTEDNNERVRRWVTLLGREDLLDKIDANIRSYRVCSAHFEPSLIRTSMYAFLEPDAVPTLLLANQPQEGPSCSTTQAANKQSNGTAILKSTYSERGTETQTPKQEATERSSTSLNLHTEDTQRMAKLSDELKKSQSEVLRLRHEIMKIKQELQAKNNSVACSDLDDEIIRRFKKLIDMINKIKIKHKGNPYEAEYKLFALNLHYASPYAYRCLHTILKMPSKGTLYRLKMLVPPTLDSQALDSLALKIKSLPDTAKYCTIAVDEMTLKNNLYYNITSDEIIGFRNVNGKTSSEIASTAIVIMLQGIYVKWKQPIAYSFLGSTTRFEEIDTLLNDAISKSSTMGIKVKAIVSDQGSNFDKYAKEVKKVTIEKPYFIYDNAKIYYIFNAPHLIKCMRNHLLTSDFIFDGNKISWEFITQLYIDQKDRTVSLIPKITESHLQPNSFQKTKVKLAVETFSYSVAAALDTYIDLGKISEEARATAAFIQSMNDLFDVLNSSKIKSNNKLQTAFRLSHDQEGVINKAKEIFATIKAIDRKTGRINSGLVKTFVNFQITLQSIIMLHEDLQKDGFHYLLTRRLNQDNMVKFFGGIRKLSGCSQPTPKQFQRAFSKLLKRNMMENTPNSNSEMDFCDILLKTENTVKMILDNENVAQQAKRRNAISVAGDTDYRIDLPKEDALTYVSSYLLFKCVDRHLCPNIEKISKPAQDLNKRKLFSKFKDYNKQASFYGNLKMPPQEFIEYIQNLDKVFTQNFEKLTKSNPGGELLKSLQSVSPRTPCSCFPVEYLLKLFVRFRIYSTLTLNNRKCKGGKKWLKKYLKVSAL